MKQNKRPILWNCLRCGKQHKRRYWSGYCSRTCQRTHAESPHRGVQLPETKQIFSKTCFICQKQFDATQAHARYCSDICRKQRKAQKLKEWVIANRAKNREQANVQEGHGTLHAFYLCKACRSPYHTPYGWSEFCSPDCMLRKGGENLTVGLGVTAVPPEAPKSCDAPLPLKIWLL